ncbi:MAG: 4-hydroxythreonine-4-phosphate dehydrogenase PdxA [Candidatus Magnetoovum sp. WYHC-5]|nr:4-hydroxythreonine-4-phosphate dehydrogenase PdxA [Candidatus Magnetoovum sp. WYHC-5]
MSSKILITMGDPAGVGAEVALKAYLAGIKDLVFVGHTGVLEEALLLLNAKVQLNKISTPKDAIPDALNIIPFNETEHFVKCKPTAAAGRASVAYIEKAVEFLLKQEGKALVTAPISKESLKLANINFPGHTELLAHLTGTKEYAMMLCGGPLRVILVTIHTALKKVPALITQSSVLKTIKLAQKAALMLGLPNPRIAVAGLNPHAGEEGLFGDEEITEIKPAIAMAQKLGIPVDGPYPPDTIFYKAYNGKVDIIVAMYHDQGLIPLKMIAFDHGVNITIGLPFIRVSPDHGTAYDIAWTGKANPDSMIEAIKFCEG